VVASVSYSITFASCSERNFDVTEASIENIFVFLDFYVAALCNLGVATCGWYTEQVWPPLNGVKIACARTCCCGLLRLHNLLWTLFCMSVSLWSGVSSQQRNACLHFRNAQLATVRKQTHVKAFVKPQYHAKPWIFRRLFFTIPSPNSTNLFFG